MLRQGLPFALYHGGSGLSTGGSYLGLHSSPAYAAGAGAVPYRRLSKNPVVSHRFVVCPRYPGPSPVQLDIIFYSAAFPSFPL